MAKKPEHKVQNNPVILNLDKTEPKLTAGEYWEWMSSIERMGKKKSELTVSELELKIMQLEAQNKALQMQMHSKTRLESSKSSVEIANGEYKTIKANIEARLGISLNEKMIDDVTFEVKDLPTNNQQVR